MIAKVFSVLTLLVAAGAAFLGMKGKELVDNLQGDLKETRGKLAAEVSAHNKTKDTLKKTQEELESTKAELESTKGKLRETESAPAAAKMDADAAKLALAGKEKELAEIKAEVEKLGGQKIEELGKQIAEMGAKVKEQETKIGTLEKEKIELNNTVASLESSVKSKEEKIAQDTVKINRWEQNFMQKGTRGRVMAVNPGWGFAVLSIGDKQGAAANKVLIVGRGGQAIGKVKITSVETSQSIADIIPGSFAKGTFVEPGDEVIFTGDDKVKTEVAAGASTPAVAPELPPR
jgi:septal ring factor EnvC (AmiA/AmiB activator)